MFTNAICVQAGLLKQTIALQKLLASIFNIFLFHGPWPHPATHTVPADEFFRKYELEKNFSLKLVRGETLILGGVLNLNLSGGK